MFGRSQQQQQPTSNYNNASRAAGAAASFGSTMFGVTHSLIQNHLAQNPNSKLAGHYDNFANAAHGLGGLAQRCVGQNNAEINGHLQNLGNAFAGASGIAYNSAQAARNNYQQPQNLQRGFQQGFPQQGFPQQGFPQNPQGQFLGVANSRRGGKKHKKSKHVKGGAKRRRTRRQKH